MYHLVSEMEITCSFNNSHVKATSALITKAPIFQRLLRFRENEINLSEFSYHAFMYINKRFNSNQTKNAYCQGVK